MDSTDSMEAPRMRDRRVLVTGSGTGIGRGIALEFAAEGAAVALHYSRSADGANAAVQEIRERGGRAEAFKADFTRLDEVRELGRRALEFLDGIDVLVNNAGITMDLPFEEVQPEQFDTVYGVNVRSPFFLTQTLLPAMLEQGRGVIVNITSVHAFEGSPGHSVYAGTKGAIASYTRELAIELAPRGIRVNAIAPGAVTVPYHYESIPGYDPDALGKMIPVGFMGVPRDVGRMAVFLASDDARYVVGQTLIVDGGTTSWMPFSEGYRYKRSTTFGKGYVPGL